MSLHVPLSNRIVCECGGGLCKFAAAKCTVSFYCTCLLILRSCGHDVVNREEVEDKRPTFDCSRRLGGNP